MGSCQEVAAAAAARLQPWAKLAWKMLKITNNYYKLLYNTEITKDLQKMIRELLKMF